MKLTIAGLNEGIKTRLAASSEAIQAGLTEKPKAEQAVEGAPEKIVRKPRTRKARA